MVISKKEVKKKHVKRWMRLLIKDYSIHQLAGILEVSERSIYRWINGESEPQQFILNRLQKMYSVRLNSKNIS